MTKLLVCARVSVCVVKLQRFTYDIDVDNNNAIKKFYYFEFKRTITIYCQFPLPQFTSQLVWLRDKRTIFLTVDLSDHKILFSCKVSEMDTESNQTGFYRSPVRSLFARLTFWHSGIGFSRWSRRSSKTGTYRERS